MNQPARRPAGVVRQRRGGRHFAGAEFPVTSLRSRRLWTALVTVAMTLSMTFLPGAQVVQAKQKTPSPTVQAAPTPSSDAPVVEAVVAPSPSEETTVQAPELDAAESPASDAPATEPVTEEPVLVTPTLVEPEASAEGERAPPVADAEIAALEPTTDAAPAALEPQPLGEPIIQPMLTATSSVASSSDIYMVDDGGADDQPGQKDMNYLAVDNWTAAGLTLYWGWDDTAWGGGNQATRAHCSTPTQTGMPTTPSV